MSLDMEEKDLVMCGNKLTTTFAIPHIPNSKLPKQKKYIKRYTFGSRSVFCVKVFIGNDDVDYTIVIFVNFVKLCPKDELDYTIKLTSNALSIANKCFTTNDGTWHVIYESYGSIWRSFINTFDVTVTMDIVPCASPFATLHEDTELTDFELRGEDGSVHIHRAVLAASSPVLRRMLGGTWRETTEGHVDVPGTSKTTLQYLKDYVYLGTLPETGLEQLLLLASYYMMSDLEQKCVYKLAYNLTAQNACDLMEFVGKNKMSKLMLTILEAVQNGAVNVNDMRVVLQEE